MPRPKPSPTVVKLVQEALQRSRLRSEDLARGAGVSVSALEKYQGGLMLPAPAVREELAHFLEDHGRYLLVLAKRLRASSRQ